MNDIMDGYIRVSARKGRGGPSYISPKTQREAIERWAEYKGITIAEWHVDEDWSGGTQKRPGLERAIGRAISGETGGIVSWKIDRFSRFTEGALRDLRRLQDAGARLAFVQEDIDTSAPYGKFVYVMMLAMAELVLDNIKAGWITAKSKAVERGAYISRTPFGYERQDDGTIVPHPIEAQLVLQAYEAAAIEGVHRAVEILQAGAPAYVWTVATVRRMLARVVYLGQTHIGQFEGKTHDALVSRLLWDNAQVSHVRRSGAADFPLTGLVVCANCDQPMVGGHGGADSKRRVYRCSARTTNRAKDRVACSRGVVIIADRLESYVREETAGRLATMQARITIGSDEAGRLAQAHAEAVEELEAFAANETMRRSLGPSKYEQYLDARAETVARTAEACAAHARSAHAEQILSASDLTTSDDPQLFLAGVTSLFHSIVVSNGRGLSVADRVRLVPLDHHRTVGKAAAQNA